MGLQETVTLSRKFGSNEEYVLSGGGNTSYKDDKNLYIKASGVQLATITEDGFASMDRKKLDAIWGKSYSEDPDKREAEVLQDLMDARGPGEEKRPSVETLLHALFPQQYVFHMHPPLVNGLTCSKGGETEARRIFGDEIVWIPTVNPGYILALTVRDAIAEHQKAGHDFPNIVFLQNHGVFVARDTPEEIERTYDDIFSRLKKELKRTPDFSPVTVDDTLRRAAEEALQSALSGKCIFFVNREIARLVADEDHFTPVSSAFSPDHIVYYGHEPLFIQLDRIGGTGANGATGQSLGNNQLTEDQPTGVESTAGRLAAIVEKAVSEALTDYTERNGELPRIVAFQGLGVFACAEREGKAETAKALFLDAVKIAVYSESFGGHQFMPEDQIAFIRNWEVEKYRSSVSFNA